MPRYKVTIGRDHITICNALMRIIMETFHDKLNIAINNSVQLGVKKKDLGCISGLSLMAYCDGRTQMQ